MSHKVAKALRAQERGTVSLKQAGLIWEELVRQQRKQLEIRSEPATRRHTNKTRRKGKIRKAKQLLLGERQP